jgi:hypothetical protein
MSLSAYELPVSTVEPLMIRNRQETAALQDAE